MMMSACAGKTDLVSTPRKLHGINGEALYMKDPATKQVIRVIKEQYVGSPHFSAEIVKDTIRLGEKFVALIGLYNPTATVEINDLNFKLVDSKNSSPEIKKFEYAPSQPGQFTFIGVIKYDSTVVPIEYKFVVMK